MEFPEIALVLFCVGITLIGILAAVTRISNRIRSNKISDEQIMDILKNNGYECWMDEGKLKFKRHDGNWYIDTINLSHGLRRIYFTIGFEIDEQLKQDHNLMNRLVCIVGSRNQHAFITWDGSEAIWFSFCTVLRSKREFLDEFNGGMRVIDYALDDWSEIRSAVLQEPSSNEHHPMGFSFGTNDDTEQVTEIRAEKQISNT